ncbi:2-oxoacid:acceptor oxidoreductase subunit alpha [Candidatus Dojkabacteria bacterium]|nr:2-oxoacid:acceptor oxidoreductase subunit alpha [Candidatus Dojkabacteria bacterium]
MQKRLTIKIAGAAGQGIKSSGLILSKAIKRSGYHTFGYTEYPSLIRGGHNVFQIEVSNEKVGSITKDTDILLALNGESIDLHIDEFDQDGGILIVDTAIPLNDDQIALLEKYSVKLYSLPMLNIATEAGGNALMKNTVTLGAMWKAIGLELEVLQKIIAEVYNKTEEIIDANKKAAAGGFEAIKEDLNLLEKKLGQPAAGGMETSGQSEINPQDDLVISGNEALSLGAIAAGVKIYSSYPMTPASSILTSLAAWADKSGMLVKQAEDEITAANMCIGANFAGTRALCGTSGGGIDLMSESISLSGMSETPFVAVLGQRHGAATGAPTWTGQGDLNMAINTGHGEFPRLVMSISDATDAFYLVSQAFNFAEQFQIPVLLLTEKYIAESSYVTKAFDVSQIDINRGELIDPALMTGMELRYKLTENGISPRWYPGQHSDTPESTVNSTFIGNSDEHDEKGRSTEDEKIIKVQFEKRTKKFETLKAALPEPAIIGGLDSDLDAADIIFITWGSNKTTLEDAAEILREQGKKVQIIHFSYLWPLKTETLMKLAGKENKVYVVEQNIRGQFAELIKKETGLNFTNRILRYDSKPFYLEDILEQFKN